MGLDSSYISNLPPPIDHHTEGPNQHLNEDQSRVKQTTACYGAVVILLHSVLLPDDDPDSYPTWPRFVPWPADTTLVKVPRQHLKDAGWTAIKSDVTRLSVKSYVDLDTGEIIPRRDMFKRKLPVPKNAGMQLIDQLSAIGRLGKKARELACFLLKMRNNRGSFVMPLNTLLSGYINRNRPVPRLTRSKRQINKLLEQIAAQGVIAQEQALGALYQKNGKNTSRAVLEESSIWYGWPGIFMGQSLWGTTIPARLAGRRSVRPARFADTSGLAICIYNKQMPGNPCHT